MKKEEKKRLCKCGEKIGGHFFVRDIVGYSDYMTVKKENPDMCNECIRKEIQKMRERG